jgi:AcrR family transcriptional regulator
MASRQPKLTTVTSTRAAPLPPEQRRATIIKAALPLLRVFGTDVTTKQIAEAAGVAEGTVFRAFTDKESLIQAAVAQVFDPSETTEALRRVDVTLPLRWRLITAIEIIRARLDTVWELMSALRMLSPPEHVGHARKTFPAQHGPDFIPEALMELIEPDREALRVDPMKAARILRLVTFGCTHPRITDSNPMTSEEVVDLILNGLLIHPGGNEESQAQAP